MNNNWLSLRGRKGIRMLLKDEKIYFLEGHLGAIQKTSQANKQK